MRIALISDLHGNQVAMDGVLADIKRVGADLVVNLGDTANLGPQPCEVLQTLRDLGCANIMGNHDEFLIEPELLKTYTQAPPIVAATEWCRAQITEEDLDFLRSFVRTQTFDLGGGHSLFCFHGSPASHMDDLLPTTEDSVVDDWLGDYSATVMAGGHTHIQMIRQHRGTLVVNPGSLGAPFKEYVFGGQPTIMPYAEYAIVGADAGGVGVTLRRVELDRDELIAACANCDNPLAPYWVDAYKAN